MARRRLPALFMFCLNPDAEMSFRKCFSLQGNIMDLAVLKGQQQIIYSIDHYHVSSSTTEVVNPEEQLSRPLMSLMTIDQNGYWKQTNVLEEAIRGLLRSPELSAEYLHEGGKPLSEFLYSIENLRKQGQDEND